MALDYGDRITIQISPNGKYENSEREAPTRSPGSQQLYTIGTIVSATPTPGLKYSTNHLAHHSLSLENKSIRFFTSTGLPGYQDELLKHYSGTFTTLECITS